MSLFKGVLFIEILLKFYYFLEQSFTNLSKYFYIYITSTML